VTSLLLLLRLKSLVSSMACILAETLTCNGVQSGDSRRSMGGERLRHSSLLRLRRVFPPCSS
jgi:hypothetical protein